MPDGFKFASVGNGNMKRVIFIVLCALPLVAQDAPKPPDELIQLRGQLAQKDAVIAYLRSKGELANARAELLQNVLNGAFACIQRDGIPGIDGAGDPTCTERSKPPVTPATAPVRTTP